MPLYEYECQSCAHRFERIQKYSDPPPSDCPNCGGPVQKLISSPAIQFKGSGFYITDYAKGGSDPEKTGTSKATESADSAKSGTSSSEPAKSESSTTPSVPAAAGTTKPSDA